MPKRMCKLCWEMVEETGPCPVGRCEKDFGVAGVTDEGGSGDLAPDVLPAGAWTGAPQQFVPHKEGAGFKRVYAKCVLHFDREIDVPGSDWNLIAPMQDHVNPKIVANKVAAFAAKPPDKTPIVPVVYNQKTGRVTINGDGHHTFVACLKSRTPVCLLLYKVPFAGAHKDWRTCTYKEFELNSAAATGTKFK